MTELDPERYCDVFVGGVNLELDTHIQWKFPKRRFFCQNGKLVDRYLIHVKADVFHNYAA